MVAQPDALPSSASVVVIGGGVMGTSIASHLVARGESDVVLLESATLGSGSSAKPIGGYRAQFSDETNILLGLRSATEYFMRFEERYGVSVGLNPCGYLFLISREEDLIAYEDATNLQRSLGLAAEMITVSEVVALNPLVRAEALVAGQFATLAGSVLPDRIIAGFIGHARSGGAQVYEHTTVRGFEACDPGAAVVTNRGTVRAGTVIIATGAWSQSVGTLAGVVLPVVPLRRQLAFTHPSTRAHPTIPFTIDVSTNAYFHNVGSSSLLFGLADPHQERGFDRTYDDSWLRLFRQAARTVAPSIADFPVENGWAGLYEMTPDGNALIGETDQSGFRVLYAVGFSGHGVLQSPAVGEVIADLYFGRTPFIDVSRFSADRFTEGSAGLDRELAII